MSCDGREYRLAGLLPAPRLIVTLDEGLVWATAGRGLRRLVLAMGPGLEHVAWIRYSPEGIATGSDCDAPEMTARGLIAWLSDGR